MSMTDAEIREALARAERATCSCHIEITRVHGFPQGHRSDCARTDVPRLAADLLAARAERDEQARIADHNLAAWKQAMDAAKSALDERDEALAFLRDFLHTTSGKKSLDGAPLSRLESAAQRLLSPTPSHTCQIHRATSGASDCGLSPCEEAKVHRDRGASRPATVRRAAPAVAEKHGPYCPKNPDATIRHMVDFCTCGPTPAETATYEAAKCATCGGIERVAETIPGAGMQPIVRCCRICCAHHGPDCRGCGGAK